METSFGQGTVCELNNKRTLAEVYYFIQGSALCGAGHEYQGFLDPILEYEPLADSLRNSTKPVLLLDNGKRLHIKIKRDQTHANSALPIFFRTEIEQELDEAC
jgi:hypothetical protein